jgi:hypothetical protein
MKTKFLRMVMAIGVVGAAIAVPRSAVHAQANTVGSIRGQIRDKTTNEPALGATVAATSTALQGEQVVLADDSGLYFLTALPPGEYSITVYYNNVTFSRSNVIVQVGKEAVVNITVDTSSSNGKPKGETIEILGTAPVIDQGSTKTGQTITGDFTNNIPVGRTFGQVLSSASGTQNDAYGTSVSGATSVENVYVVEGINTTDTARGGLSSNLPNEFVQETEVITGGYNAEYGRATGGIVNVVTKQGSNELHGSVFAYYAPGSFSPAAKTIQKAGGSVDTQSNLDFSYDLGAEIGGPIIKDKLWFHVGFNPSHVRDVTTRVVGQQIDRNNDGIPDADPSTGLPLHERVSSRNIPDARTTYFFTGKINGEIDQNNQFQLSLFGNPTTGDDNVLTNSVNNTATYSPDNFLLDREIGAYDVSAKYTSKFNNGGTQIDALVGFHGGYSNITPHNSNGGQSLVQYNYTRSLYDFADIEGASIAKCNDRDPNDPYPKIQNCPVNQYTEQGLGNLEKRTNNRTSGVLSLTQRVKALGYHVLKAGADLELAGYDSTTYYTNGATYRRSCNTDPATGAPSADCDDPTAAPGTWHIQKYAGIVRYLTPAELMDPNSVHLEPGQQITDCAAGLAICGSIPQRGVQTSNRSIGAYAQDSWQILPNLTINLGLRYEQQVLNNAKALQGSKDGSGGTTPDVAFTLNNWAPRLGAIYDPTSEGKSKLFVHWGRFYENIPNDINVRSFGGEIDDIQNTSAIPAPGRPGYIPACDVNHVARGNAATSLAQCNALDQAALLGGGTEFVAPGITGQYSDELVLGAEYELLADFKVGLTYTHRTVPNVIEDMSADGANDYLIANPGNNYDAEAAQLEAQAMAVASSNPALAGVLQKHATDLRFIKNFDKPSRNYDAVTLRVEQRPSRQSLLIASYTYAVERGNYPGLFSTETNQLDPNITSLYDLPDLLANRYGALGLDRPHNLKLDGFYQINLKQAGMITLGTSARAQSGIAHNALGHHPVYGDGESYLLPRGSISRSPVTTNVDLHASYGRRLDKNVTLEGFVRVFNLFDAQDELNVDENFTFDGALPIVGGDQNDLKHAKALNGSGVMLNQTLTKNQNFDHVNLLTVPRSFQFGMRLTF